MTEKEFYEISGGDYEDAKKRLMSDALIRKFLLKFPLDRSFEELKKAMEENDVDAAFSAAHTLKGVALNLSLSSFAKDVSSLTDFLRPQNRASYDRKEAEKLLSETENGYNGIVKLISEL